MDYHEGGKIYPIHSYLSILNRIVRTFRKWIVAYQIDVTNHEELRKDICKLTRMYNNSVHRGLSSVIGLPTSPNDVDANYVHENILVYNVQKHNMLLAEMHENYYVKPGERFRVYKNKEKPFEKRPSNRFEGIWTVQGYDHVNRLIHVSNGNKNMLVPRYYLKKI